MFQKIFVESELKDHPQTLNILSRFNQDPIYLDRYNEVWGQVKKPYLQKRENLNLFLAKKRGELVKEAPPAYGLSGEPHYYFVNAFNCIYECDYCYLQGYFNSPDIVLFLNHEDMINKMQETLGSHQEKVWFHAGEYSDSLALNHLTGELDYYFDFFGKNPNAYLELRTKSVNVKGLLKYNPLSNLITSFSLSPSKQIKDHDLKTPPLKSRLSAIKKLSDHGHPIGLHFDPIIYNENIVAEYEELINNLRDHIQPERIEYISLGVVRFTADVFHQMKKNYPKSNILHEEFIKSFDNKIRYPRPIRMEIMQKIKSLLLGAGIDDSKIYLCME